MFDKVMMIQAVLALIPMLLSLTVHEYAHARVAYALGDDTAEKAGRLTLNPISHMDLIGTLILPFCMLLMTSSFSGGIVPILGWAKPVPVEPSRFRRFISMRKGITLVAAAGPLANIVMAFISIGILRFILLNAAWQEDVNLQGIHQFCLSFLSVNLSLAVFNMLPFAPLDGEKVVVGLLPSRLAIPFQLFSQRYGFFAIWGILLCFNGLLSRTIYFLYASINSFYNLFL